VCVWYIIFFTNIGMRDQKSVELTALEHIWKNKFSLQIVAEQNTSILKDGPIIRIQL
jgi:hypothetical protein